jgi:chromosome segregation ATPase
MATRVVAAAIFVLALAVPCFGQNSPTDSQTLQAILTEIRAIHEEVKVTQTTQILLTELNIQQGVVSHATQRADDAQAKLSDLKEVEKASAAELTRTKDKLDQTTEPQESKALTDRVEELKRHASDLAAMEPDRTTDLQTAQQQLKDAQDKLDDIQNQLNAIVKRLTPSRN